MAVDRRAVLEYRIDALGLHRDGDTLADLAVFDLGVQDTQAGSARLALAARLPDLPPADPTADGDLTLVWSLRGAPHLHRTAELPALAAALWPIGEDAALAQLSWPRRRLAGTGITGLDAWRLGADAVREVVTAPMTKGAVSSAVTKRIPRPLTKWCTPCNATHINESLLRAVALPAGTRLEFDRSPATAAPIPGWPGIPSEPAGRAELIAAYLRLLGPAGPAEAAAYLGIRQAEVRAAWPADLAEVVIDGKPAWLPSDRLPALRTPRPAELVRLLPSFDPFLQARDRGLLLPDTGLHRMLWTVLGNPGAVLVDGEIAGVWRPTTKGTTLTIKVLAFAGIPPQARQAIEAEADRVAAVRGARDVRVDFTG